jgi:general secretion pathway protein A
MVFESQSYLSIFDETIRAIPSDTTLIVVTGDIGTGKTLLCRSLSEVLASDVFLSEYASPPSSSEEFLWQLARELGASLDGSTSPSDTSRRGLLTRCQDLLRHLAADDASALIVVDEAHELSSELLDDMSQLLSFATSDTNHLQILLVGRPELESLLERPEAARLAQCEMKRLELRPLRDDEIGRYVDRRLWVSRSGVTLRLADSSEPGATDSTQFGNAGEPFWQVRFARSAIRRVAQLSEGIPAVVNLVCDRALQSGLAHRKRRIGARHVLDAARDLRLPVPLGLRIAGTGMYLALSVLCLSLAVAVWMVSNLDANGRSDTQVSRVETSPEPAAPSLEVIGPLEDTDGFLISIASFQTELPAMSVTDRLLGLGLPAFTRGVSAGQLQVVVGPYMSLDEAEDARRRLPIENLSVSQIISVVSTPEE